MFRRLILAAFLAALAHHANAQDVSVQYLTRADAAEILLRASRETIPAINESVIDFPDIFGTEEETKYLRYAIHIKMLDPDPLRGLIFPYRSVSRAEFLKMMTIAFSLKRNLPHSFTDAARNEWYAPFAGIADHYAIFADAKPKGELKPNLKVTKGTARKALESLFQKEPRLKPKNFEFEPGGKTTVSTNTSTPGLAKKSAIILFRRKGSFRPDKTRLELIRLVNEKRRSAGLHSLKSNLLLQIAAQRHAKDMFERGYFDHTSPEGLDFIDRIRSSNYLAIDESKCICKSVFDLSAIIDEGKKLASSDSVIIETNVCGCNPVFAIGENLAQGQLTPREVVEDWMNSPGHRANILHPKFDEIGIGLYGDIWVQNFGRAKME